ncbi:uncharacterized protein LOC122653773 [Telopea speciosissima]|uniref:uncharacterized protein LOC122653773 n=1 Tax=Telopea speciosissima TaxID=54955 RepID=UPI001CC651F9|nr:uncharacterized protein LOC122653773 [Telopea speciosissima]
MAQVVGLHNAAAVWSALERLFSSHSRARIMQLRYQLQNVKKGSLSVSDYYNRVKTIADSLAAANHPVDDSDLILYILGGLGAGYESFATAILTRTDPISSEDLHSLLLSHELHLDQFRTTMEPCSMALIATTPPSNNNKGQHPSTNTNRASDNKPHDSPNRGRGRGRGRYN